MMRGWLRRVLPAESLARLATQTPSAPVARVAVNMRPTSSPWGGGNQWLVQMVRHLSARGYDVTFDLNGSVDAIILVDPRVGDRVKFGPEEIHTYKIRRPEAVCLHRVNE